MQTVSLEGANVIYFIALPQFVHYEMHIFLFIKANVMICLSWAGCLTLRYLRIATLPCLI